MREEKRAGRSRVDSFHRERNRESLNHYLEKIRREKAMKRSHARRVQDHEEKLRELSKTVEFKKSYLQEVQNEIFKYRTDLRSIVATPARSRKNTESNKSDSRVLGDYSELLKGRDLEG